MRLLPHWVLTDNLPAFYDTDSGAAIEQTAKVYAAMNELITEYNGFVDDVNKAIEEYNAGITKSFKEFKDCITNIVSNYIKSVDLKLKSQDKVIADGIAAQDKVIAEAIVYIKENLRSYVSDIIADMHESGNLEAVILGALGGVNDKLAALEAAMPYYVYNEETERLDLMNIPIRSE